jgi:hypothetical protein
MTILPKGPKRSNDFLGFKQAAVRLILQISCPDTLFRDVQIQLCFDAVDIHAEDLPHRLSKKQHAFIMP